MSKRGPRMAAHRRETHPKRGQLALVGALAVALSSYAAYHSANSEAGQSSARTSMPDAVSAASIPDAERTFAHRRSAPPPSTSPRANLQPLPPPPMPQQAVTAPKAPDVRAEEAAEADETYAFAVTAPTASIAASATIATRTYTVRSGDFLGRIANSHDCTVAEIMAVNGKRRDIIHPGEVLVIPSCDGDPSNDLPMALPPKNADDKPTPIRMALDSKTLPELMRARGFHPPTGFKAYILEVTFDPTRSYIVRERAFDWRGTSDDADGWNPASTVKLFAAVGVLDRLAELGMSAQASVKFRGRKVVRSSVAELINAAIIDSDNIAYDRLVQLAGFDRLHRHVLTKANDLGATGLRRAYEGKRWKELGESPSLRYAPAITVSEGAKSVAIPSANGQADIACKRSACTTLRDLAELTRRVMLQEQLPKAQTFGLPADDLVLLRRAMRAERARGNEVVDRFAQVFDGAGVRFYSKPGFAGDWYSDNVYIYDPARDQAWIVSMAGYPGRASLNDAATTIAAIIDSGELRDAR